MYMGTAECTAIDAFKHNPLKNPARLQNIGENKIVWWQPVLLHFDVTEKGFFAEARSGVEADNGCPGEHVRARRVAEEARGGFGGAAFGVEDDELGNDEVV